MKVIHLFSPQAHHGEQGIAGNKEGLKALLSLIQKALDDDTADAPFFTSDGEGFDLFVKKVNECSINRVALPYTEDYLREDRECAIYPWGPEK